MPGHWEHRVVFPDLSSGPIDPESTARAAEIVNREMRSSRVWVEDNPVFGRREFFSEEDARRWRRLGDELRYREASTAYGDRWSRREADRLRAEMGAMPVPDEAPRERWGAGTAVRDWATARTTPRDWAQLYNSRLARHSRDMYEQTFTYSGTTTGRTGARPTIIMDDISDTYDAEAMRDAMRYMMPDGLKKTIKEVKDSMGMATPTAQPAEVDPYLSQSVGTYNRVYISVIKKDEAARVRYWETMGRVSPKTIERVLARYYATQELVDTLMVIRPNSSTGSCASTIHPDPGKNPMGDRSWNLYFQDEWKRDTRKYRVMHWDGEKWLRRFAPDGDIDFVPVNPHEDFEE